MIKIGICDDEAEFRKIEIKTLLKVLTDGYEYLTYEVCEFETGEQLVSYYAENEIDIILLDIEMGNEHGFDVAEKLMTIRKNTRIVFITSHESSVFEAFACRPIGFVRKRIFEQEFKMVMSRIIKSLTTDDKLIVLGEGKENYQFLINEIRMIDTYKHNVIVSVDKRDVTIRDRLSRFENSLGKDEFVKVNRGCIVNIKFIRKNENGIVTLLDGKTIIVSRSKAKDFHEKLKEYTCRGN